MHGTCYLELFKDYLYTREIAITNTSFSALCQNTYCDSSLFYNNCNLELSSIPD